MSNEKFKNRMIELRNNKGVSARDMSLTLGQSENYINHIENGKAFPSMTVFFSICEYFNITSCEFFDYEQKSPDSIPDLINACKKLTNEQIKLLTSLADNMKK